jgi:hypothetical protein
MTMTTTLDPTRTAHAPADWPEGPPMARTQARIFTSIWHDKDFLERSAGAQRLYLLALSQEGVSFCGVVGFTASRWSTLAPDTPPAAIRKQVAELVAARFVLVDTDTEELWARSLLKYDGVLKSPNLIAPMIRDFDAVHSYPIRNAIRQYLWQRLPEGLPKGFPQPIQERYRERFGQPIPNGARLVPRTHPQVSVDPLPVGPRWPASSPSWRSVSPDRGPVSALGGR